MNIRRLATGDIRSDHSISGQRFRLRGLFIWQDRGEVVSAMELGGFGFRRLGDLFRAYASLSCFSSAVLLWRSYYTPWGWCKCESPELSNKLTPVEMTKGECSISDEVLERDGEKIVCLTGGREGEKFIAAWHVADGAWPVLPNNQQLVSMILAGARAGQQASGPIRKYVDQNCLVTKDGRFVTTKRPILSPRLLSAKGMDTVAYRDKTSEIKNAIAAMEKDMESPHIALLINSMYRDEYKDDAYQRLHYLRLWESLAETGENYLGYQGNIRSDDVVVAGKKTLRELKKYRNNIAH